jgi:hypothetical protein
MTKSINITVADHFEDGFKAHFTVLDDAVVRAYVPFDVHTDDTMSILVVAPKAIKDSQCQSVLSLCCAAMLNYNMVTKDIVCNGITWDELVRRG